MHWSKEKEKKEKQWSTKYCTET